MTPHTHTGGPAGSTQAVMATGDCVFGVNANRVVQVVPRPAALTPLPRSGRRLAGVLPFREHAVPVVDLQAWQDPGATADSSGHLIAVLSDGAHWIGLLVNEVRGLMHTPPERIAQLHHDQASDEFFHSVATLEGGALLSLLDPARLMQQALVWADAASPDAKLGASATGRTATDTAGSGARTDAYAVLRLGKRLFGVPTACIAELLVRPAVQPVWSSGEQLLGMMRWRERDVPLLNPTAELGEPLSADATWVAMLCDAAQGPAGPVIALPCSGLERVERFALSRVQPVDGAQSMAGTACTGLVQDAEEPLRLLNADQLVASLALTFDGPGNAAHARCGVNAQALNPHALVVFHARTRMAVPIQQLQSIEPLPDTALVERAAKAPVPHETLNWRGQALPLICLQQMLWPGQPVTTPYRRVLITAMEGQPCAVLIGEVEQLIAPKAGYINHLRLPQGRTLSIVTHTLGSDQSSYELIDFDRLAAHAHARTDPNDNAPAGTRH